ncbi:hypothetical protein [Paenibacillus silvisoli]|uniref:hypothetical protein n=1 Tax=Paenibacillus silvisoli TaxID=3110539 RepID=UPI0028050FDA|nr:hypothetical protein [Paenibacillus silvisoli]
MTESFTLYVDEQLVFALAGIEAIFAHDPFLSASFTDPITLENQLKFFKESILKGK